MKKKVVILYGGNSYEHEVSCISAKSILENIDRSLYDVIPVLISKDNKWYICQNEIEKDNIEIQDVIKFLKNIDVVFPIIHGNTSEDGKLQGMFEMFNIKYVGCDTVTSAICYDKEFTKIITSNYGIPTVSYKVIHDKNEEYELDFDFPVIVKPALGGSSIGINVANDKKELIYYVNYAFEYSDKVIIEKFIKARELECAVLITDTINISSVGEIVYQSEFYDYDAKYVNDSKLIIPCSINDSIVNRMKKYIRKICVILDIKNLARIDFLYEEKTDMLYLLEINTLPGFTTISMYPKLFKYDGIDYKTLITTLIENA